MPVSSQPLLPTAAKGAEDQAAPRSVDAPNKRAQNEIPKDTNGPKGPEGSGPCLSPSLLLGFFP